MLLRWPNLPTGISYSWGTIMTDRCPPPLSTLKHQQRLWKMVRLSIFDTFTPFSTCHLQIFMLPQWPNPVAGISCPPGKRNEAFTYHPSCHFNTNRGCEKKQWDWCIFLRGLLILTFCSFQNMCFHFKFCLFSFLSGLPRGSNWHNKPFHNVSALGDEISFLVSYGFLNSFCSLKVWCDVSLVA